MKNLEKKKQQGNQQHRGKVMREKYEQMSLLDTYKNIEERPEHNKP